MSRFLQLHILTEYPVSNPNRDDLGRPKSAMIGGVPRQRISSQALKRAIRIHPAFEAALTGHTGKRTQRMGEEIIAHLESLGADHARAVAIAKEIVPVFGAIEDKKDVDKARTKQLAFVSPDERAAAFALAEKALSGDDLAKDKKDLVKQVLRSADGAVDIAMFGRMLADNADLNRDAAVQVAHAITVNRVTIEDDFYTAVDDLKKPSEDAGAGFVGEAGFGSGVYYLYVCVDRALLVRNLAGDKALAARGLAALVQAVATAVPGGKINSYANHTRAKFILAEKGDGQPLNLFGAFTRPMAGPEFVVQAVRALEKERRDFAATYGQTWAEDITLEVGRNDAATLDEVAAFASAGL
ncbi:type I-E CRISPR-associated protein Cas7/Cse4/CasC [Agrobacterium vitis]|uniref:type I-E CRISPR-associated protein Cas7/Cse4/CasC n=1 Tax=Agrobacterium vitis TaxID=373 RepID=UPI0012E8E79E|nr:type I-E CRISPR-associated protein Cas7/Cse4/CasC [Agrobacterium vitis]MVA25247.1 type I-E CRISPR-associated protein Cas7/Cse4/CasC [Agrobacterium vitis]